MNLRFESLSNKGIDMVSDKTVHSVQIRLIPAFSCTLAQLLLTSQSACFSKMLIFSYHIYPAIRRSFPSQE